MVQGGSRMLLHKSPHKSMMRVMKLKSTVRAQGKVIPQIPCLAVMTNMVSCWQRNKYQDKLCVKEITAFLICVNNAKAAAKNTTQTRKNWWSTDVVNENLKRFSKKQ